MQLQQLPQLLASLPPQRQQVVLARLKWIEKARPKQLPPPGNWRIWLILAGRGFGKTKTSSEDCWNYADNHPNERIAIVAPTSKDLRETMLEGPSGIMSCAPKGIITNYNKSF